MTIQEEIKGWFQRFCEELPQDFCPYGRPLGDSSHYPCNDNEEIGCEECRALFILKYLDSKGVVITCDRDHGDLICAERLINE